MAGWNRSRASHEIQVLKGVATDKDVGLERVHGDNSTIFQGNRAESSPTGNTISTHPCTARYGHAILALQGAAIALSGNKYLLVASGIE